MSVKSISHPFFLNFLFFLCFLGPIRFSHHWVLVCVSVMVFPLFTFTNEHFSAKLKTGESSTKQNSVCRRPLTNRGFYTVLVHQMWVPVISLKKSFSLDVHLKTNPKNPFATWALRCIQTLQVSAHTPLGNITPTMKLNNPLNVARGGGGIGVHLATWPASGTRNRAGCP